MKKKNQPYRRLWRSRKDRKIAGVCGGLADYLKVDPFWIRFAFVLFLLAGGAAFLVYVIMWLLIPLEPT
ncbi:PspC domain-containing protein [Legionella bononiensis]|uniref:PspC domain-containing protein n=1 Tax=Legionella bononiensis TaxID=2793102 RepID=A0ABS1W8Z1_9GAMM|nr:PspC domain-containing protein [Legionella bononiensis]MBL7479679.1 PspC domain-containing protein [Legionella bononiensis]MBL7525809.1 PspC domain-containing protein [Legionella bononiensis]MBL7561991.1 PspC domain-containing protein [Legionella bononiensis]